MLYYLAKNIQPFNQKESMENKKNWPCLEHHMIPQPYATNVLYIV